MFHYFVLAVKPSSFNTFLRAWETKFPHVKVLKHDVFSRCEQCTSLTSVIENGRPDQKAAAMAVREKHWERVRKEKQDCYAAMELSTQPNEDFLFCEIDGMDSAKTILPHFHRGSKAINKECLLKVHLTCVKYSGDKPDELYYFTDCFPHDSSNTITVMYKTLLKVIPLLVLNNLDISP